MLAPVASAASAYSTYTYSSDMYVLDSPDAYVPDTVVDADYMGIEKLVRPTDIVADKSGNVFIADAGANKIIALDPYYHFSFEITEFVNEQGVRDTFSNPNGVFVNNDYIYVCDTDNARIVMFERDGDHDFVKIVPQPTSNLFEEDAIYKPVAVAIDAYGRMFIVSSTTYQGIIVMSDNGDFYGFIGAQKVSSASGVSAALKRLGLTSKNENENVSSEYNNITIDDDNFVYATISTIDPEVQQANITSSDGTYAPVKKYNASGTDVLRRNGFFAPSGEVIVATTSDDPDLSGASEIIDAAVGPEGTRSIIDKKRSKIFTYEGNLLFAFGDKGSQKGNITTIAGLCYQIDTTNRTVTADGDEFDNYKLLVLDQAEPASFTVFRRTEYGDILITALYHQNNRDYDKSESDWHAILQRNNNFDLAYIGIGKALARGGEYKEAMTYFKYSHEKEGGYAAAFKEVRKAWASKYFIVIPIVIVAVIVGLTFFFAFAGRVNKRASLKVGTKTIGEEILYAFHIMVHPFDGFWDLKHEKRGSIRSALIILLVTVATFAYQSLGTGYIFDQKSAKDYSSVYSTLISVLVPLLLWVISNWCFTTLFDGEGKFTDIFIATCYALIPLPLFIIPSVILSNVLVPDESGIIKTLTIIAWRECSSTSV